MTCTSFFNFCNYAYYRKSLGYPSNSFDQYKFSFDYFGFPPLLIKLNTYYKRNGEQALDNYFYATKTEFPMGTVQEILGTEIKGQYFCSNDIIALLLLRYENYKNANNTLYNDKNKFYVEFNIAVRFIFINLLL